jgi:hypothetical protein
MRLGAVFTLVGGTVTGYTVHMKTKQIREKRTDRKTLVSRETVMPVMSEMVF